MAKRLIWVLLLCAFAGSVWAAGSVPDLGAAKTFVKTQMDIDRLRMGKEVNWQEISAKLELLRPVIIYTDSLYGTHYEQELPEAIKNISEGNDAGVNNQVLSKGMQHIAVMGIRSELDLIAADPNRVKESGQKVAAYFEGIRPVLARRDKGFFGGKKTLEAAADSAIERLGKTSGSDFIAISREIEDIIARTYGLSMLYEVIEVEKNREDTAFCDIKRAEANMFYRIIGGRVHKRSARYDEKIKEMLAGPYKAMDSKTFEPQLVRGLGVKLR